ncbi:hypothetical protein ACTWPT_07495 [Nonomuraea sp. 3N208]|uniref:hypothetical protein n=1 Tax=Nonomuraea sp. 3N208 TaxID=3457421 RepID=UPI003FCC861E
MGANRRSVDALNARLQHGWVVNQGISGNRLLVDEVGEHALARLERHAGARAMAEAVDLAELVL